MSSAKQRYRDISPVTLQLVGGAATSSLYCGEVEGLSEGLVEAFLVELYRCKLCQFTCGLKSSISSHLLLRHHPSTLNYLAGPEEEDGGEAGEEGGMDQLSLTGDSKQSDEDEEFLLYNMLESMSPSTCDISTEGGLQVAHTCEVSTLFDEEEESSVFRLKEGSVDLSDPPATPEEMAQSAHLMSLGLCRISASKPPLAPPTGSSQPLQHPPPHEGSPHPTHLKSLKQSGTDSSRRLLCLLCPLCPLTLTSKRLLDVHIRSHSATGGFSCVCCTWTADSWEELEPHWRSHNNRRRKRRRVEQTLGKKKTTKVTLPAESSPFSCLVCRRTFTNTVARNSHQETHQLDSYSDKWRGQLIGQAAGKEAKHSNRQTIRPHTGSMQREKGKKRTTRKKTEEKEEEEVEQPGFCCLLCPRKFSSKLTLRRHLSVHAGEKPFTCPHCAYSSRLKASLLQHLRTHTGERPYRCPECSYASIDRSSLLRHSRTHSQEKPYRCQHCDYRSIQKKSLDLHCRRHHTGEVFPCQQCQYSSPDRQLLLRHIRRHHALCELAVDRTF